MTHHPQTTIHSLSLPGNSDSPPTSKHEDDRDSEAKVNPVGSQASQEFWLNAAKGIDWYERPEVAYGLVKGGKRPTWFPNSRLNTCYNALDRHCIPTPTNPRPGDRPCFHHVSPLPQASERPSTTLTYEQVLDSVKTLAGVFRHSLKLKKGDRAVIYMPMVPEAAMSMLACARLGVVHSVVFGGFAPKELAKRIEDARPGAIIAASCGLEPKGVIDYQPFISQALSHSSHKPPYVLLLSRSHIRSHPPSLPTPSSSDVTKWLDWETEMSNCGEGGNKVEECVSVGAEEPIYTLYTSGTTGMPKGVVRANGGHAVALRYSMEHVFGLTQKDTMFTASDLGWVVGHSYILYAPLLLGCATVIFEGKPILPDAGILWKIVETYKVTSLFTAPTALRAVRRGDPEGKLMRGYDLRTLRSLFLAGERSEPSIVSKFQQYLSELAAPGALVNDNYWSTESGSPITAIMMNRAFPPVKPKPGSAGFPLPGMDVRVVDDDGKEVKQGGMGNIVLGQPLPPSGLVTLWQNEPRFQESYFDRFRGKGDWFDTGDAGMIDDDGYVHVMSRADDIINVAGHRLSTGLLEQVVSSHSLVAECCVVGQPDSMKGHVPFALVTPASSATAKGMNPADLLKEVNLSIRTDIGGIACLGGLVTGRLPKTRSGKTLRRTIRNLVENGSQGKFDAEVASPPTIEDPSAADEARDIIYAYFKKAGGPHSAKAKL